VGSVGQQEVGVLHHRPGGCYCYMVGADALRLFFKVLATHDTAMRSCQRGTINTGAASVTTKSPPTNPTHRRLRGMSFFGPVMTWNTLMTKAVNTLMPQSIQKLSLIHI